MSLSPYARDLVRKASVDAPSVERRELARKRFAEASMAAVAGAAASATAASTANQSTAMLSSAKMVLLAKVVGGLAIAVGAAALVFARSETPASPVPTVAAVPMASPKASMDTVPPPSVAPEPSPPLPPPVVAASATPLATKAARAEPAVLPKGEGASSTADPLVYEAKVLEGARACLAAADVACARTRLNDHARIEHPRLRDEAAVMNIEVLRAEGRRNDAREAAATFVEQRPTSPYLKRVRAIVLQLNEEGR